MLRHIDYARYYNRMAIASSCPDIARHFRQFRDQHMKAARILKGDI